MRYRPSRLGACTAALIFLAILEKGRDITDGGARYNFSGVQGIGIANLSDSLHALKGMVFEQQRLSFDELLSVFEEANFATQKAKKSALA
ncbi:pyruvate formate lyase family protein [Escherichia coli]